MKGHTAQIAGWILLAVGLLAYLVGVALSLRRVLKQYSTAMTDVWGLRLLAVTGATGKMWPFLVMAVAGAALLVLNH